MIKPKEIKKKKHPEVEIKKPSNVSYIGISSEDHYKKEEGGGKRREEGGGKRREEGGGGKYDGEWRREVGGGRKEENGGRREDGGGGRREEGGGGIGGLLDDLLEIEEGPKVMKKNASAINLSNGSPANNNTCIDLLSDAFDGKISIEVLIIFELFSCWRNR